MAFNYKQGIYEVQNKDKYIGTQDPRYLSSYEFFFFKFADMNPNVIEWGSETAVVEYYNPVKQRKARYLIDIYIKYKDKDGNVHKELVEIKPQAQSKPPKKGGKSEKTFLTEVLTWQVNKAKWQAASAYAEKRDMKFRVITEKHIFGK